MNADRCTCGTAAAADPLMHASHCPLSGSRERRIVVEPDPPALYVVYEGSRRIGQYESMEAAQAAVRA